MCEEHRRSRSMSCAGACVCPLTFSCGLSLQETSLEAVTHWFAIHGAAHGVSGAEVRLCVATQLQGEVGSEEGNTLDSAALEWCIEHGFEHVPLPCQHDGDGDASSLREAQGVARLREALQAHTWPGLVAKPRGGIASVGDQVAGKSLSVAAAVEALEREASVDKGDDEHDRFESLMAHMQRARSAATGGDVPDDVRRATAAVLAMQMARLLGVDDEGESSDGENVDDGQEHHEDGYQPLEEPGE